MTPTTISQLDVAKLFDEHHQKLVRIVGRKLVGMDDELVEDAVMFAWEQLVRGRLQHDSQVLGWLVTVATYEAYTISRKRRSAGDEPLAFIADATDLHAQAESRDELSLMGKLKPQQRLALGLLAQGYSYNEICEITGKTYTWVNRHIAEGRATLRQLAA